MSLLEVRDIHAYYGDSYVLQGISLKVEKGAVVAVLGRNGVGKTTLIRSIMRLTPVRRGNILFHDQDITYSDTFRIARLGISLIPQGRRLFSSLTTEENMVIAARSQGSSSWSLDRTLVMFPRLKERLQTRAARLSGGEQQMLAFGRALVRNGELLLMDEPTEGLAPLVVQQIGATIKELKEEGLSMVLVEQNVPFALKHADYVYIMSKGKIVYESSPKALEEDAQSRLRYLGV
jgi:branched-chain amino acid transport system ATP-binding protein